MTSIDREIEKVRHDLILGIFLAPSRENDKSRHRLCKRLDALYAEKHALEREEDAVLSRFEAEHNPKPRKAAWWDKLGMEPAGDTTLKDREWQHTKP